ncbi:MAG: chorismate mutase [Clostridia bacterium]|nr:chorismate mutase [Clostridia bacterium]
MKLEDCRKEIDGIDRELIDSFIKRMKVSQKIAEIKKSEGMPIYNGEREKEILKNIKETAPDEYEPYVEELYMKILELSKKIQKEE